MLGLGRHGCKADVNAKFIMAIIREDSYRCRLLTSVQNEVDITELVIDI
jgi:hypothetical protein